MTFAAAANNGVPLRRRDYVLFYSSLAWLREGGMGLELP